VQPTADEILRVARIHATKVRIPTKTPWLSFEDVVQMMALTIVELLHRFEFDGKDLLSFTWKALTNERNDLYRKFNHTFEVGENTEGFATWDDYRLLDMWILFKKLNDKNRKIASYKMCGYNNKEIAHMTGRTHKAVESAVYRVRRTL
jgi:DNA-directed RNA polymerase specialized sigma24 family protein